MRGFDTHIGYYTPCTSDYWYHGAPGGSLSKSACNGVDFSDSAGDTIQGAAMSGPDSLNGTYDQKVFTDRAVQLIREHNQSVPMYLYLAYRTFRAGPVCRES